MTTPSSAPPTARTGPTRTEPTRTAETVNPLQVAAGEIERLARSNLPEDQFFERFTECLVPLTDASAGAVWLVDPHGRIGLMSERHLDQIGVQNDSAKQRLHLALLVEILQSGQATIHVPGETGEKPLPTPHVLLLAPIRFREQAIGVVELFLPTDSPVEHRLERLQFTEEMAGYAARYLEWREEAASPTNHLDFWNRFERFAAGLHRSLHPRDVAAIAVNDGRLLLGCDRVSLAVRRGSKAEIIAISGQDRVQKRSNLVRQMKALSTCILRAAKSVTYAGSLEDVPPPLERAVTLYVQESGSRLVCLLPLLEPPPFMPPGKSTRKPAPRRTLGVLVIEKTGESFLTPLLAERSEMVAQHVASALQNAHAHQRIFLLPLWRFLGNLAAVFQGRTLLKCLAVAALLLGLLATLLCVPAAYRVEGDGQLMPVKQREIFAPWEGKVVQIFVQSGQKIPAGSPLIRLQNDELETQLLDAQNQWEEKRQLLKTLESSIHAANARFDQPEEIRLRGRHAQTNIELQGLSDHKQRLEQQLASLTVTAPFAGTVATFQLEQLLMNRPVSRGERLLELMDEDGPWHLELEVPENRLGHVFAAQTRFASEALPVDFVLATMPEESFTGTMKRSASRTGVSVEQGSIIKVEVAVEKSQLPPCRIGAEVQGKIHCGDKSLFYVLFGDVVEFVQRRWW